MIVMAAAVSKVDNNIKDRVRSVGSIVSKEMVTGSVVVTDLINIKPVTAAVDIVVGTLDNVGDFIKEQAEITRRWLR